MARPNTSRPQAYSWLIGCTKKPSAERGPKPSIPIAQPQRMMIAGVRQEEERETEPSSPICIDMLFLVRGRGFANGGREPARLMHLHGNPKSKTIAFREELAREHCISSRPQPTRRARLNGNVCGKIWRLPTRRVILYLLISSISNDPPACRPDFSGFIYAQNEYK